MSDSCSGLLTLIPGEPWMLFIVQLDQAATVWAEHSSRLLDGLRTARALLGFAGLQRDEERLEELLPWAGNV